MRSLIAITAAAFLTLSALTGCGGSDSSNPGETDVAPTFTVASSQQAPITHSFTSAGTYTLTLTGTYMPAVKQADALNAWFSFSGQGTISGNSEPVYTLGSSTASVDVKQSIDVTLTGSGPWEMTILCETLAASGSVTGLTLTTVKH